jgi:hypothetical protein
MPDRHDDPRRAYLREIGSIRLLTPGEERTLAAALHAARMRRLRILAQCPGVAGALLDLYDEALRQERRMAEVFLDCDARAGREVGPVPAEADTDSRQRLALRMQELRALDARVLDAAVVYGRNAARTRGELDLLAESMAVLRPAPLALERMEQCFAATRLRHRPAPWASGCRARRRPGCDARCPRRGRPSSTRGVA